MASRILLPAVLYFIVLDLPAAPLLSPLYGDHAVLQRNRAIPIFGTANVGEKIRVTYRDKTAEATAGRDGKWSVILPEMKEGPGVDLTVDGEGSCVAKDVAVGDVWLFSGQSNIQYITMSHADGFLQARAMADQPQLRQFKVGQQMIEKPGVPLKGAWTPSSQVTVGDFTAVGYYFARALYPDSKIPVGIINCAVGGTDIEAWMSAEAIDHSASGLAVRQRWDESVKVFADRKAKYDIAKAAWDKDRDAAKAAGQPFTVHEPYFPYGPGNPSEPSVLFNGMVDPLLPCAVRGVVWYQGENNTRRATAYGDLLRSLIRDWRAHWEDQALPFLIVQLPNYNAGNPKGEDWAVLRDQQAKALVEPATALAVTIDLGNPIDIHPRNKKDVGERLALLARAKIFGEGLVAEGPSVKTVTRDGDSVRIRLECGTSPAVLRPIPVGATPFELAGANGNFQPANVRLEGDTLVLVGADGVRPETIRYLWCNNPAPVLYNEAGLPAAPFRITVSEP